MNQAANKIEWCLRKAEKEGKDHRGLARIAPNRKLAESHIIKAMHYLEATEHNRKGGFTDICATTLFYAIYQSLLAIGLRFGYESRNQECTFALMHALSEEGKIPLDKTMLEKVASLSPDKKDTSVKIRERMQYGTELDLSIHTLSWLDALAKEMVNQAKEIVDSGK